jgi:hypothetical protein
VWTTGARRGVPVAEAKSLATKTEGDVAARRGRERKGARGGEGKGVRPDFIGRGERNSVGVFNRPSMAFINGGINEEENG